MATTMKASLLCATFILSSCVIFLLVGPIAQDPTFHDFADKRPVGAIPNFLDVISNVVFIVVGAFGVNFSIQKTQGRLRFTYNLLFLGLVLTGVGSAYYHLNPDNYTLIYDRIPMTIVFASFLCICISQYISEKLGFLIIFPLSIMGVGSVIYWYFSEQTGNGDLRPYALIQFYPIIAIILMLLVFPRPKKSRIKLSFLWVVTWYAVAKVLEHYDDPIFHSLKFISGHTLKHLAAGVACVAIFRLNTRPGDSAASHSQPPAR